MNSVVAATVIGISKLGNFIFSSSKDSVPVIDVEYPDSSQNNNVITQNIDVDGAILLLSTLVSKITGKKLFGFKDEPISLLEAQADALNIAAKLAEAVNSTTNIPAEELIDLAEVQSNIFKAMVSGYGYKVPGILHSYIKEGSAMLKLESAGKLLTTLQQGTIYSVNKTHPALEKHFPYLPGKINDKPQTHLSNVSLNYSKSIFAGDKVIWY